MLTLAMLATSASLLTGAPCAAISNTTNTAAFAVPGQPTVSRTYTDYGDNLGYNAFVPKKAWRAENATVEALQEGKPGPKIRVRCRK